MTAYRPREDEPGTASEHFEPKNGRRPVSMPPLFLSTPAFLAKWKPKDFLLKPILEEGRLYTITGPTGTGKTAIVLLIALHVAMGWPLGSCKVRKANVLILAGENPDDVRTRWLAMLRRLNLRPEDVSVRFVEGRFGIAEHYQIRELEAHRAGLVIPDTLQAFFLGDDSNSNDQMKLAAETFREVTALGPAVLCPAHPVKGASRDRNIPYGGGALLNEVDGNLSLWGPPDRVELSWCGKFRGSFEPMHFAIDIGAVPGETDSDGDPIKAVAARLLNDKELAAAEAAADEEQRVLLKAIAANPGASLQKIADACRPFGEAGWSKSNTKRRLQLLVKQRLAEVLLDRWTLTPSGKRAIETTR